MGWWQRLFGADPVDPVEPLYDAIVARARAPRWYEAGAVPDTVDGRFDMVAAVLALVLLRLEGDPAHGPASARLTERFVTDMDGQLREMGIGDIGVGKHIGKMMAMLGGRIGAYRDGLAAGALVPALERNLYRGSSPEAERVALVERDLLAFHRALAATASAAVLAGALP